MIAESYDLVTYSPTKRIYEAVKRIPKGCVANYRPAAIVNVKINTGNKTA